MKQPSLQPKKHRKIKLRFALLGLAAFAVIFFTLQYIDTVGDHYDLHTRIYCDENHSADTDDLVITCEPEGIVAVEGTRLSEDRELLVSLISEKAGETHLTFHMSVNGIDEPMIQQTDITVSNMGTIIEHSESLTNFNGYQLVNILFWGLMGLTLIVMIYSFYECVKKSDYSYSMIAYGGIALFLAVLLTIVGYKMLNNVVNSFSALVAFVLQTGEWFVSLLFVPMLVMAVALSVSNIWLLRHEGFRPANALGIGLSVVWYLGLAFTLNIGFFGLNIDLSFGLDQELWLVLRHLMTFIVTYFECMLLSTVLCAFMASRHTPPRDRDYIIILGCAIRRDGSLTPLLRGRADAALEFDRRQFKETGRHVYFVPSGGQGNDEVISEAEAMERYLLEQGVETERILKEDKSVNTLQNMGFSKAVIEQHAGELEQAKIAFSTTNYHVFRGYILSRKNGFTAQGISAKTKWYFFPNAFIREFIGLLADQFLRHILIIICMILILIGIALVL